MLVETLTTELERVIPYPVFLKGLTRWVSQSHHSTSRIEKKALSIVERQQYGPMYLRQT